MASVFCVMRGTNREGGGLYWSRYSDLYDSYIILFILLQMAFLTSGY